MDYLNPKYDLSDFNYFRGRNYVENREPLVKVYTNVVLTTTGQILEKINDINDLALSPVKEVIYVGNFSTCHFGNMLIDYISLFWFRDIETLNFVYTSMSDIKQLSYIKDLLALLDIPIKNISRITSVTCFEKLIYPEASFVHDKYILPVFASIFSRNLLYNNHIANYEKIYLTRTQLKRKKEVGEWRFERFFEANGYKIIALETYTLLNQAQILRNAKIIASLEGTHAHGVVWRECQFGGEQIVLRKQKEVIPRQMMINQLWRINTTYIDVFEEPFKGFPISHDRGPFLMRWTNQIEQFAQDNEMYIPQECRKGYWRDMVEYTLKCCYYKIKHSIKHLLK